MKNSTYRFLRFNPVSKILFNIKWIDKILRKLVVNKYHKKHYTESSNNSLKINDELNPILKKYKGYLGHGVALFILRDKKLPSHQDLDYDIYDCEHIDQMIEEMDRIGYKLYFKGILNNEVKMLTFYKYNSYIDFFMCNVKDKGFDVCTVCSETVLPKFKLIDNDRYQSNKFMTYKRHMTYTEIQEMELEGNKFYLPKDYDQYFSEMYGLDWREPKQYFNWALNPKNNMPKKIKKNVVAIVSKDNYFENYK